MTLSLALTAAYTDILVEISRIENQSARLVLANIHTALADKMLPKRVVTEILDRVIQNRNAVGLAAPIRDIALLSCVIVAMKAMDRRMYCEIELDDEADDGERFEICTVLSWDKHLQGDRTHEIEDLPEFGRRIADKVDSGKNPDPATVRRVISRLNGTPRMVLGGKHRVFWVTSTAVRPADRASDCADLLRDQLGLVDIKQDDLLFVFHIKHDLQEIRSRQVDFKIARPTFLEGLDHKAFKSKKFAPPTGAPTDAWGAALNLEKPLATAGPDLDGAPELVCSAIDLQNLDDYECTPVGRVCETRTEDPDALACLFFAPNLHVSVDWSKVANDIVDILASP